jgi:hypothetical protein
MKVLKVTVTKLQAARRQLETALDLYFNEKDPVSIHALATAAYNVIRKVNRNKGGMPMLVKDTHAKQFAETTGKTEKEIANILNEAENFFKHADSDPNGTLTFDDGEAELFLFDAIGKYGEITQEKVPIFAAFHWWFVSRHPYIVKPGFPDKVPPPGLVDAAKTMTRRQWFDVMMLALLGTGGNAVDTKGNGLAVP